MSTTELAILYILYILSRAVHTGIEMVYSLETASFINAFTRMTCRRGVPPQVLSDNGRTFVKAEKELKKLMLKDTEKLTSSSAIKWSFILPYASHHGGIYEIMIKAAKSPLSSVDECRC